LPCIPPKTVILHPMLDNRGRSGNVVLPMRVTGGIIGGREIRVPKKEVRPTQDKVRAALFSSLGAKVAGARVLDVFAGSGALGLEAWSRGASLVCWVEGSKPVFRILRENIAALCAAPGGETRAVLQDAVRFLQSGWQGAPFDLILADPPYDREGKHRWLENALLALEANPILAPDGVFAFELSASEPAVQRPGWVLLKDRKYGETQLLLYARASR